jgi:receptor-interacting serine/threonine-protein kinase 4
MHKIKLFRNKRADAHTELDKIDVGDSVRETLSKVEEGKKICTDVLFEAIENFQYASTIQAMVYAGANVNSRNIEGKAPLHLACEHGLKDVVQILIDEGGDIEVQDYELGYSALHAAAIRHTDDVEIITILLKTLKPGVIGRRQVNCRDFHGETPLMLAAMRNNVRVVKALLKKGSDFTLRDHFDRSALECAKEFQNEETYVILKELYDRKILGRSPLP